MNQHLRRFPACIVVVLAGLSLAASSPGAKKQPNRPPTVALTSPSNGASFVAGAPITLTATASDADGSVRQVRFYADGDHIGTADKEPYSVTWHRPRQGSYKLTAEAVDTQGAATLSAPVRIVVNRDTPPTVNITSPADHSIISAPGALTITANASDADGHIRAVRFLVDGEHIGTSRTAPYSATWQHPHRGNHRLVAVAIDNVGEHTRSEPVSITVKRDMPPTVSLTSPASTDSFTAPASITLSANASDADGTVTKVTFLKTTAAGTTAIGSS